MHTAISGVTHTTTAIPDQLVVHVGPGKVIKAIDQSYDGNACVLQLDAGEPNQQSLCLGNFTGQDGGDHQIWGGELRTGGMRVDITGSMKNVAAGGSHSLVVWIEDDTP